MVARSIALSPELDFLPDDTEESLLGTTIHQGSIVTTDTGMNYYAEEHDLPWLIGNQLKLIIPRQGGGNYYPSPDLLVHTTLGGQQLASLSVAEHGPPALVVEVTSPDPPAGGCPAARDHDLDTLSPRARPRAYAECGIAEYLVYDPLGDFIPEHIRAWRLGPERPPYVPWLPDPATGRWHSALGVSFAPIGLHLRVFAPDGSPVPTMSELRRQRIAQAQAREAQAREIAALRAELARRGEG